MSAMIGEGADGRFWEALKAGRLEMPRCSQCGRWHWPAVWRCGDCGSWEQAWANVPAEGRVFAWTRTHHAFAGTEGIGVPFVTVVVELPAAGGLRLTGVLEGDETGVAIGAPVSGRITETEWDKITIPTVRWRLSGAAA